MYRIKVVAVITDTGHYPEFTVKDFREVDSDHRHGGELDLLGFSSRGEFDDVWATLEAANAAAENMSGAIEAWRKKIATRKPY